MGAEDQNADVEPYKKLLTPEVRSDTERQLAQMGCSDIHAMPYRSDTAAGQYREYQERVRMQQRLFTVMSSTRPVHVINGTTISYTEGESRMENQDCIIPDEDDSFLAEPMRALANAIDKAKTAAATVSDELGNATSLYYAMRAKCRETHVAREDSIALLERGTANLRQALETRDANHAADLAMMAEGNRKVCLQLQEQIRSLEAEVACSKWSPVHLWRWLRGRADSKE